MYRCTKCILPENYPGISFTEDRICSYCISYKPRNYLGGEALKEAIKSYRPARSERNSEYDCVVGLSGGRDSSYLLHYLVKDLNLKVVAYCVDNGFMPEQTNINIANMVDILKVKCVIEKHHHLSNCIKHHVQAWMHRPSAAMVGMLCAGCRLDIDIGLGEFALKNHIPVIVSGSTPLEGGNYKRDIMKLDPKSKKLSSFILGYFDQVFKNPMWVTNPTCLATQIQEYYVHFSNKRSGRELKAIGAFYSYIRWEESKVMSTIQNELKWKKRSDTESSWRGDCDIALLKLYLYKKTLGFNDKDDGFSCLIRDGQMSREEAMMRLEEEGKVPEEAVREIFARLGLDFYSLKIPEISNYANS